MTSPSQQPRWDIYEAAILLEAVLNVDAQKETRKEAIRRVSDTLRKSARRSGLEINDTFRNENGITFQFQSMEFSALGKESSTHKTGSKLFDEVVALYRNDPAEYKKILTTAHEKADDKAFVDNKELFKQWLSVNPPKKYSIETIINALDEGSDYCRTHSICKESFWEIDDKYKFTDVTSKLLRMRLYRFTHRSTASVLDKVVPLYKQFLNAVNQDKSTASGNSDNQKAAAQIENQHTQVSSIEGVPASAPEEIITAMRISLNRTIEYLKTRYDVRLHYDHLADPGHSSNDMLYKVRNNKKDIMWVYYIDSQSSRYISIETEPEYIEDIEGKISGFTRIQIRASHPRQKMFFDDFDAVEESIIAICNSIDHYFEATNIGPAQEDRMKLYQKLYSISRVYDDPSGLTISKIMSLLGKGSDEELVRNILDNTSWTTKVSDDVYSFSRKADSILREEPAQYKIESTDVASASDFYHFLHENRGMADATCRSYVSAIRTAESFAKNNGFDAYKIYDCIATDALQVIRSLLSNPNFTEFNIQQHNRFSAAFAKLSEYLGQAGSLQIKHATERNITTKTDPKDYDKEKFKRTLLHRYRNGMQFDSIDFDNFRENYEELFDESLAFNDTELEERLRYCGVFYKDRLFPAEGIMDGTTREKLFEYIDGSFSSGKKVLYYKAIFEDLSYLFASCYTLSDEQMLRVYIEHVSENGKYFFFPEYMSTEKQVSVDHYAEIEEFFLNTGKPIAIDEVCGALSHIPKDQVDRIIKTDSRFLRNAKGEYFHVDIFEASNEDLNCIAGIINDYIKQNEYAIWTDVWNDIQEQMPIFLENNLYLSGLGVRNVLAQRLNGKFNFESAVISKLEDRFTMSDIYQLYAKHHSEFTADDIYNLSKELDTVIYFYSLADVSVRVSHDQFVSKEKIRFDVEAIDKAIESFMSMDYIRIREVDSFLAFPNVGYEWNEYLLESFVYSFSKKFSLLSNGFSLNNVAGAIVKKESQIKEFVDVCAAVLAEAPISLKTKDALNYLADVNMITRRSYRDLDTAIRKASQIRARKG